MYFSFTLKKTQSFSILLTIVITFLNFSTSHTSSFKKKKSIFVKKERKQKYTRKYDDSKRSVKSLSHVALFLERSLEEEKKRKKELSIGKFCALAPISYSLGIQPSSRVFIQPKKVYTYKRHQFYSSSCGYAR